MKQFVIIGIDKLGLRLIDELSQSDCEIMIIDKDPELVEKLKDKVTTAYIADVIDQEIVKRLVPSSVDAVIIDLDNSVEAAILVCNYLKKIGVKEIIATAETDQHGEILHIVGATSVIYPNKEAARRIAPALISSKMFSYFPISSGLVLAEVSMPEKYYGMTLIEADLRRKHNLNVVALKKGGDSEYVFFDIDHKIQGDDLLLVAGDDASIDKFIGIKSQSKKRK
ncbi:MAG: TrkA family potassium uptake protein [Spirochaetales bacterium]|nr:TrkA family potassium uptake protein [Spirochaetales bacterium]